MRLVLFRHGIAEDRFLFFRDSNGAPDSERPLTDAGIRKTKRGAAGLLKSLDYDVQIIASSPYVRARQTAELLRAALPADRRPEIQVTDLLAPGCRGHDVLQWLASETGTVILVGHEPDMSYMMTQFCGCQDILTVKFGKAGACLIQFDRTLDNWYGELQWLMSPRFLRRLGRS